MSHTDQLSELIRLWNCLDSGQREGVLRLLRAIIREEAQIIVEGKDDDETRLQDDHNGD